MYKPFVKAKVNRRSLLLVVVLCVFLLLPQRSVAQDSSANKQPVPPFPPPPYVTAEGLCVGVGVKWDADAVKKLMPPVLEPSAEMGGSITICTVQRGSIGPFAYANFDVELVPSPLTSGYPGNWNALGIYNAQPTVVNTLREYYGSQVQVGDARITETKGGYRAVALLNGKEVVAIEVKVSSEPCQAATTTIDYVNVRERTGEIFLIHFPVAPDICNAEPVSAKVTAPAGDVLLDALQPKELLYAVVGKNAAGSWGAPITVGWTEPITK